jgi:hypothetical protein
MHRIDGPGATVDNRFTDGDPVAGIQATMVTDDWANDVQEEIVSVLSDQSIAPVKGTQNQLLAAIKGIAGKLATELVAGVSKIATQTLTDAGVDDSTIVTPKKLRKGVSFNIGANGYVALPSWLGGFIFQWGSASTSAGGGVFVTWPTAFPNVVVHASGSANASVVTPAIVTASAGLANGSFFASNGSGAAVAIGIFWLAIGR